MKKAMFRTYYNSRSIKLLPTIIRSKELDVTWKAEVDALGDSVIVATGSREDIQTLREIFECVC